MRELIAMVWAGVMEAAVVQARNARTVNVGITR